MAVDQFMVDSGSKMIGCVTNITDKTIQSLRANSDWPIHTVDVLKRIVGILYPFVQSYNGFLCEFFKFFFDDQIVFNKSAIIVEAADGQIILSYFVTGNRDVW